MSAAAASSSSVRNCNGKRPRLTTEDGDSHSSASLALSDAIALADPFRGQGTRYIHTFDHHDDDDNRNKSNNHKNGTNDDNGIGHVVMSIALSTTFRQTVPGQATAPLDDNSWGVGYEYARTGNPTRGALERALAQAEQASFAVAFSSGSAAVSAILQAIVLLHSPSASSSSKTLSNQHHMLCMDDVYGGTQRYLRRILAPTHDVHVEFVDLSLYDKPKDERNQNLPFRDTTRLVWLESPTNPTLKITDMAQIALSIESKNEQRRQQQQQQQDKKDSSSSIYLVVDNTFCSPYFQSPLSLGAHAVVHSATKYLGGHSDVVLGVVCTNDATLYQTLRFIQNGVGAVPSPFDCFLVHRGLKTLHLRMEAAARANRSWLFSHDCRLSHSNPVHWFLVFRNAMALALFLEQGGHAAVRKVIYPGLVSHPQHELAKRQQHGFGAMVSFSCVGGREQASIFLTNLRVFCLAESLGAVESLAESPSLMTHASVPDEQRAQLGIDDSLIRLSVGVESCQDLVDDVAQALDAVLRYSKQQTK